MSSSTNFSIAGTHTSAPVALATGATAPTWSKCVWVSRIPSSVTPSSLMASSSLPASSPGSTISARSEPSRRKMYEFSATGPTVNIRTSMSARLLPALPDAVDERVGDVAERDVQEEHERREDRALDDVAALEEEDD